MRKLKKEDKKWKMKIRKFRGEKGHRIITWSSEAHASLFSVFLSRTTVISFWTFAVLFYFAFSKVLSPSSDYTMASFSLFIFKIFVVVLKETQTTSIYSFYLLQNHVDMSTKKKAIYYLHLCMSISYNLYPTSCVLHLAHMASFVN